MSDEIPYTEKKLKDWAGWRAFRDGKALFERGVVEKVTFESPFITGQLNLGPRGMRSKFEILKNGLVENHCPCRDNQERGLICSHLVAMGLEVLKQHSESSRNERAVAEKKRIDRIVKAAEGTRITRVRQDAPGAVDANLYIELDKDWEKQLESEKVKIHIAVEYEKKRYKAMDVPVDVPFAFPRRDENLLYVLEDVCRGALKNEIEISVYDFINILRLHQGKTIHYKGRKKGYTVHSGALDTVLEMDMDRDDGELILNVVTELPDGERDLFPQYIIGQNSGWIFAAGEFYPLSSILPKSLHEVYTTELVIPRTSVPAFLMTELPQAEKFSTVRTEITPDLFFMKPAKPTFRLVVKGSPASLAATLYARYDEAVELVAGRADMKGNFAIPDPRDLLKYRIRNMAAEKAAVEKLHSVGFDGRAGDTLKNIVGPREVLNFLGTGVPQIRRFGWQVELEGRVKPFAEKADYVTPVVHVDETEDGSYFDVSYEYEVGTGSVSERDIQRALMKGDSFIERNGRTILLDGDAIMQAREVFEDCAVGAGEKIGSFRMSGIYGSYVEASLNALDGINIEATPSWMESAKVQNEQVAVEEVELHPELRATLRSYQQEGVNWLRFLERRGFCGILADEMGLGKTLQTLAWVQMGRADGEQNGKPALIICPTSLVENWKEEAAKFTPNLKALILHGTDRHRKWKNIPKSDLVITSYALMRRDIEKHLEYTYSIAILDEAQHIKNRTTQNALAAKKLKADHKLVLTGTPIENGVTDLWSIMDYLMPGYLGDHKDFREHYELPILNGGTEGDLAQIKLRRKLHPFLLRRLKKHVAKDLPEKIIRVAPCKLTQDQHKVYKQLLEDSKARINEMVEKEGFNKSRMEILKTLLRLRQTCNHIDLLKLDGVKSKHPSAKMELFFELLNEAIDSKHRVLVFSQFTSMLAILKEEMTERGIKFCYLDGSTKDRQDVVRKFNKDHTVPVFLMSLKAGGTGLNLTGADMVIHFDPWWNPAVEDQATDRAHRIGQKRTVYSVKLITKGTVEEKVLAMQEHKKGIIDSTLTTDEQVMQKLTWEDVQELLNL
ncbi:DEAD/DEAH box helicase [Pontiella agarivorans]|uniref:SNF2-related protein n=1 Tax=Pontiella agarivorans TaxID=3038953 RepID=A0ABU5N1L1_9BACT|nr:SNF2-related protein [Pontiella agarivorans]MDZ8120312.1 SNF2-related protein [Pontiella agarivorans]